MQRPNFNVTEQELDLNTNSICQCQVYVRNKTGTIHKGMCGNTDTKGNNVLLLEVHVQGTKYDVSHTLFIHVQKAIQLASSPEFDLMPRGVHKSIFRLVQYCCIIGV